MSLLHIAENAAIEAMKVAVSFLNDAQVLSSDFKDIKTIADLRINDCIIKQLDSTNIPVLTEEANFPYKEIPDLCWIVDPLDGTYNFSRKFPYAGISICLWENNSPIIGIVKDIFNNITYSSQYGQGSWLNNKIIRVSNINEVKDAVLATGFPSGANYATNDLMAFVKNIQEFKKIRSIGAASLMLSYVASGVFDVYCENDIYIWDVAAGLSLVKNAGGEFFFRKTPGTYKCQVLATNANIFEKAKSILL